MSEQEAEAKLFIRLAAAGVEKTKAALKGVRAATGQLSRELSNVGAAARAARAHLGRISSAAVNVGKVGAAASVGLGGLAAGFIAASRAGLDSIVENERFARSVGLTFRQYQVIRSAAEKSGMEVDALNGFLINFADKAFDASIGAEGSAEQLASLGISAVDARGELQDMYTLFLRLADSVSAMPDGTAKTGALSIFAGDDGARAIELLNLGSRGIEAQAVAAARAGEIISDAEARVAKDAVIALDRLLSSLKITRDQIALIFAPDLQAAAERFRNTIIENKDAIREFANSSWDRLIQYSSDLVAAIDGRDGDIKTDWIAQATSDFRDLFAVISGDETRNIENTQIASTRNSFRAFSEDMRSTWETVLRPLLDGMQAALRAVSAGLREAFGIDLDPRSVGILLVAAKVTGLVGGLVASLRAVSAIVGTLLANPLIASIVASGLAILNGKRAADALGLTGGVSNEQIRADLSVIAARGEEIAARDGQAAGAAYVAAYVQGLLNAGVAQSRLQRTLDLISRPADEGGLGFDAARDADLLRAQTQRLAAEFAGAGAMVRDGELVLPVDFAIVDRGTDAEKAAAFGRQLGDAALDALRDQLTLDLSPLQQGVAAATESGAQSARPDFSAIQRALEQAARNGVEAGISNGAAGSGIDLPFIPARDPSKIPTVARSIGGMIRGAGSTTSDSILARVSNGEYVLRASAVRRIGTRMLDALNAGVLPAFAGGGLVAITPTPSLPVSDLGSRAASRAVILQLPDGSQAPLRGDGDVVAQLEKRLRRSTVAQAARKPGWYK